MYSTENISSILRKMKLTKCLRRPEGEKKNESRVSQPLNYVNNRSLTTEILKGSANFLLCSLVFGEVSLCSSEPIVTRDARTSRSGSASGTAVSIHLFHSAPSLAATFGPTSSIPRLFI